LDCGGLCLEPGDLEGVGAVDESLAKVARVESIRRGEPLEGVSLTGLDFPVLTDLGGLDLEGQSRWLNRPPLQPILRLMAFATAQGPP